VAERAVLEALRARRAEIEAREQAAAAREQVVLAAERRLSQRVEELSRLQQRLETLERDRVQREEAGMRGLVRLYEGMRPRDAATIFDDLEMPVLVRIVDRMRDAKASPVMGAMKPERARMLTTELARLRAERVAPP
jgi:flagellar motility protein MotE (MotC chaperone)